MGIRLGDRDRRIMLGLARNGFLNTNQIKDKWFSNYTYCMKRLKQLCDEGYINVDYIDRFGKGIYHLQKQGLDYINSYYGENYKQYTMSAKIHHFLSSGEFYINFPYEIIEYKLEYHLGLIVPDIYIKYKNKKEIELFVEIDNSSKRNIIESKIKAYNQYLISPESSIRFEYFPRCIIVTDYIPNREIFKLSKIPFRFITFKDLKTKAFQNIL